MPFHAQLIQALEADAHRPKRERRTVLALRAQISEQGYSGGYRRVADFVRAWREGSGRALASRAFVPLTLALGEAFQFDWSDEGLVIDGIYRRLQVAHLKLCASRAFWLVAYPSQGHEMLFDAHTRVFRALGGVPQRGIYDNMKTAVDRVQKDKARLVDARFASLCAHYLFDADFCEVASGWEKCAVEEKRAGQPTAHLAGSGRATLRHAELELRCRAVWSELHHPEHGQLSVAEMLERQSGSLAGKRPAAAIGR